VQQSSRESFVTSLVVFGALICSATHTRADGALLVQQLYLFVDLNEPLDARAACEAPTLPDLVRMTDVWMNSPGVVTALLFS
jgi:hypothetical protein